jgi:Bacterial Ig-like domain
MLERKKEKNMNRIFWRNPMFLGAFILLLMAVSCANPPLKTSQTRALGETPTIVSIEPANGAVGVQKDTNIVVTFSQPMNTLETQAAYSSASPELDATNVMFSWSADQTVLTINPNSDLAYSTGGSPILVFPIQYSFSISDLATDIEGSALLSTSSSFRTFKLIQTNLTFLGGFSKTSNDQLVFPKVGDFEDGLGRHFGIRAWVQFYLGYLPLYLKSSNILNATLYVYKESGMGSPYKKLNAICTTPLCPANSIGSIDVEQVRVNNSFLLDENIVNKVYYNQIALRNLGSIDKPAYRRGFLLGYYDSTTPNGWKTLNVTDAIKNDWNSIYQPVLYSTFRLHFQRDTNFDNVNDFVSFDGFRTSGWFNPEKNPRLLIDYLVP